MSQKMKPVEALKYYLNLDSEEGKLQIAEDNAKEIFDEAFAQMKKPGATDDMLEGYLDRKENFEKAKREHQQAFEKLKSAKRSLIAFLVDFENMPLKFVVPDSSGYNSHVYTLTYKGGEELEIQ